MSEGVGIQGFRSWPVSLKRASVLTKSASPATLVAMPIPIRSGAESYAESGHTEWCRTAPAAAPKRNTSGGGNLTRAPPCLLRVSLIA